MQTDGNLVLYEANGRADWASHTSGNPGSRLVLQDDSNAVIYRPDNSVPWATNTSIPIGPVAQGDTIKPGEVLYPGQTIRSANGRYSLTLQSDGNLVLSASFGSIWGAGTNGKRVEVCKLLDDGSLTLYEPGMKADWTSRTANNPGSRFVVQDDANGVLYRPDGRVTFATNTIITVAQGNLMRPGEVLYPGQFIRSSSGVYTFVLQTDGNLVLYVSQGVPLWASNTNGRPVAACIMQTDGSLVVLEPGRKVDWTSNTSNNPGSYFTIQNDGNGVVYKPGNVAIWATHTRVIPTGPVARGNSMNPGDVLFPGQSIQSLNGKYTFTMQSDGDLYLYGPEGAVLWTSKNGVHKPVAVCIFQADGDLVLYNNVMQVLWRTNTSNNPQSRLVVLDNGDTVITRPDGSVAWSTNTPQPSTTALAYRLPAGAENTPPVPVPQFPDDQLPARSTLLTTEIVPVHQFPFTPKLVSPPGFLSGIDYSRYFWVQPYTTLVDHGQAISPRIFMELNCQTFNTGCLVLPCPTDDDHPAVACGDITSLLQQPPPAVSQLPSLRRQVYWEQLNADGAPGQIIVNEGASLPHTYTYKIGKTVTDSITKTFAFSLGKGSGMGSAIGGSSGVLGWLNAAFSFTFTATHTETITEEQDITDTYTCSSTAGHTSVCALWVLREVYDFVGPDGQPWTDPVYGGDLPVIDTRSAVNNYKVVKF
jgi:hypothetical protein